MKTHNDVALLHPDLRPKVDAILVELTAAGYRPRVFETWRSAERQAELVAKGASKRTTSKHQHTDGATPAARAVDIIDAVLGWKSRPFFDALAEAAVRHGLVAGHYWKWRDSAHIEMPGEG